jgi:TolB protein
MGTMPRTHTRTLAALACLGLVAPASAAAATNGPIVFQGAAGKRSQLFTINPDGTGLKQVTHVGRDGAENPAWSPDATRIAFDTGAGTGVNIFTTARDGTGLLELPLGVGAFNGDPAYSPDGTQISFDQDVGDDQPTVHGIYIANADGSGARRVTTGIATKKAYDTESQWSPDGTRLAFTRVKNSKEAAIFTVNIDGTGLRQLTRYKLDAASPDWSPDGTRIAFNSYWDPHPGKSANIYTIRPDATGLTAVTHHRGGRSHSFRPSWAPDGTELVIARFTPRGKRGRINLFTIKPDGSRAKRLTNVRFAAQPDWGTAP